ncbi:hypothetical protein [Bacillus sp. FJAT-27445]|uniref:hypothetical protein n=1 Tax=Bacillus sp. FJAT-27445 TaxID=1679166 RepID=UPI000A46077B|nr:hypothetical protein [Bacillus sp. FJAT-27445]
MREEKQERRSVYTYNEKGTEEVSAQIMNAYNSGVIGEEEAMARRETYPVAEGEIE